MEITVLNLDLEKNGVLEAFKSIIWTDRYYGAGDFEVYNPPNLYFLQSVMNGKYLSFDESEHLMIIEHLSIHTDIENGNQILVKGRSIESILERRVLLTHTILYGSFQDGIEQLLNDNIISASDTSRNVTNFEFEASTDPIITALTIDDQFNIGDNLYNVILTLCVNAGIGFKVVLTSTGNFRFKLYSGEDRTYDQSTNPHVIFSPEFDNLLNSDYEQTDEFQKTVALVAGEKGIENARRAILIEAPGGAGSGLLRRELFVDASDISQSTEEGTLTDEEYDDKLAQKGLEELSKNVFFQAFSGQADTEGQYKYSQDFSMGDILQIVNEYGYEGKSRITELVFSKDPSGTKRYPTFSNL